MKDKKDNVIRFRMVNLPVSEDDERVVEDLIRRKKEKSRPSTSETVETSKLRRYKKAYEAMKVLSKASSIVIEGAEWGYLAFSPQEQKLTPDKLSRFLIDPTKG